MKKTSPEAGSLQKRLLKRRVLFSVLIVIVLTSAALIVVLRPSGTPKERIEAITEQIRSSSSAEQTEQLRREANEIFASGWVRPEEERQGAIKNIKAIVGEDAVVVLGSVIPTFYNTRVIAEIYLSDPYYFQVDTRTDEIIQYAAAPVQPGEPPRERDYTPRYSQDELEVKAREFISKHAPNVNLDGFEEKHNDPGDGRYFFRWEDTSQVLPDDPKHEFPFIQVGYTVGGEILSYTNSIGLGEKPQE